MKLFYCLFALLMIPCLEARGAEPLKVFVSIAPQKWLVDHIGGPLTTCRILIDKGQDPHSFEASPRQLVELSGAALYFSIGMPFEEELLHKIGRSAVGVRFVDSSQGIERIPMQAHHHEEEGHAHEEAGHAHDRDAHHDHGHDHDAHHDHGHHADGLDPHVWLSPRNLKIMAANMAEALSGKDPANKKVYEANRDTVLATLQDLRTSLSGQLAPFEGSTFYVFHPAFGYFARDFKLRQEAVETGGKSPSPKQIARLIDMAKEDGVKIIFVQPQFDDKSATAIATAIGGQVVPLDPLAEDIASNFRFMAEQISKALH